MTAEQLVELLAVLSEQVNEVDARRAAVERALELLDADVGLLFHHAEPLTVVGLGADTAAADALMATADKDPDEVEVPGVGVCRTAVVPLDVGADAARLLVARAGTDQFDPQELNLLRAMAWVLHLALRPLREMASLRDRQRMLEQVVRVQRAIANRAPLPEIFDTVTEGALALFGSELAALYLADEGTLVLASVSGTVTGLQRPPPWVLRVRSNIGRAAYVRGELVRTDDYPASRYAIPELVERGAQAAMAAPVHENATVVGSLAVVRFGPGHVFGDAQEAALRTFADQVSIALSDARTLAAGAHTIRDAVTGLPNRVLFLHRLEQALARNSRVHVIFLDLDRFKLVNDAYGHAAGDDLLRQVGRRLRGCLPAGDCLARLGGDEYAVLCEGGADPDVRRTAQRMLAALQEPHVVCGEEVTVGGSIGIAAGHPHVEAGHLLRDADTAMYQAKSAGGGRFVVFEKSMHAMLVARANLESDLRRAVERDELFVVFQPILELATGRIRTAEALVRWRHPSRGVVQPGDFIPLAEETGLIVQAGRWVLAAACAQAVRWPTVDGRGAPDVAVNLSGRQLLDADLVADVRQVLSATGLDPGRLILEITESAFVSDAATVLERLRQIRDIGVRLAIDDFGTGYSSLAYLRRFPIDILKIDRSFVEGVVAGWQGKAFLRTIVRLTETLSMTAVGEGVETPEQLGALRRVGCKLGQGFLLARPMEAAEFERCVREGAMVSLERFS